LRRKDPMSRRRTKARRLAPDSGGERSEPEESGARRGRPGRRTGEERTKAVLELVSGKASVDQLAARFGVLPSTIEKWRQDALAAVADAMRRGEGRSPREAALEKELHGLERAFTNLAIKHELLERALKDRPSEPGRSPR
jgi:transposase-like protein